MFKYCMTRYCDDRTTVVIKCVLLLFRIVLNVAAGDSEIVTRRRECEE
jgi:hypothetical protein